MYIIAALYHFTRFDDPSSLKPALLTKCRDNGVFGTLLAYLNRVIAIKRMPHQALAIFAVGLLAGATASIGLLAMCARLFWLESQSSAADARPATA